MAEGSSDDKSCKIKRAVSLKIFSYFIVLEISKLLSIYTLLTEGWLSKVSLFNAL